MKKNPVSKSKGARIADAIGFGLLGFSLIYLVVDALTKGGIKQLAAVAVAFAAVIAMNVVFVLGFAAALIGLVYLLIRVISRRANGPDRPAGRCEAKEWLAGNANSSPLASDRFRGSKAEAVAFVEDIYAMGARQVLIENIRAEAWRLKAEGGPYANTVVVVLPPDQEKRSRLFAAYNADQSEEWSGDFEKMEDTGQSELIFFWD